MNQIQLSKLHRVVIHLNTNTPWDWKTSAGGENCAQIRAYEVDYGGDQSAEAMVNISIGPSGEIDMFEGSLAYKRLDATTPEAFTREMRTLLLDEADHLEERAKAYREKAAKIAADTNMNRDRNSGGDEFL